MSDLEYMKSIVNRFPDSELQRSFKSFEKRKTKVKYLFSLLEISLIFSIFSSKSPTYILRHTWSSHFLLLFSYFGIVSHLHSSIYDFYAEWHRENYNLVPDVSIANIYRSHFLLV